MSNVEKIDAFFSNQMTALEKQEFESSLHQNSELKKEFDFQSEVIKSIQETRRAELKSMLNSIPITETTTTGGSKAGKIAAIVVILALVTSVGLYVSMDKDISTEENSTATTITIPSETENVIGKNASTNELNTTSALPQDEEPVAEDATSEAKKNEIPEVNLNERSLKEPTIVISSAEEKPTEEASTSSPTININKPQVKNFDQPTSDHDSLEAPGNALANKDYKNQTGLDVIIDNSEKKHSFHYKFNNGKLQLYGNFEKSLYEVIEINENNDKSLFLYYKDKYYSLNKQQSKITKLEQVKDDKLVKSLNQVREE